MAPIVKLSTKLTFTVSINTNPGLALKSNTQQNPPHVDTINLANKLDSALDSNSKKTNIILTNSNIEKY